MDSGDSGTELVQYGTELITDPGVQRYRFKRQVKMWVRAKEMIEAAGLEATPI